MYQSFPDKKGASDSPAKLVALHLPDLEGKSFLDLGCNEGFFCEYALKNKAIRVVGVDYDENFIRNAKERNPSIDFKCQSWEDLDDEKFDVILLASSLHYVKHPVLFFRKLASKLTENGTLVLECGLSEISPVGSSGMGRGIRHDGDFIYPTFETLKKWMPDYSLRFITQSVSQAGDLVPRFVIHACKRKTQVILIYGVPGSGKTNFIDSFNADVIIKTDGFLCNPYGMGTEQKIFNDCLAEEHNVLKAWEKVKEQVAPYFSRVILKTIELNKGVRSIVVEGYMVKDLDLLRHLGDYRVSMISL